MATPSVSFRISRSTEDLAGTLHLLSQRLVQLEQRLALLESQGREEPEDQPALDASLGNAERLLLDCRSLLEGALQDQPILPLPGEAALADGRATADPESADGLAAELSEALEVTGAEPGDTDLKAIPLFQPDPTETAVA